MRKIVVKDHEVLNVSELLECLANDVKYFLIDEGADLEKVMISDVPLIKLLKHPLKKAFGPSSRYTFLIIIAVVTLVPLSVLPEVIIILLLTVSIG